MWRYYTQRPRKQFIHTWLLVYALFLNYYPFPRGCLTPTVFLLRLYATCGTTFVENVPHIPKCMLKIHTMVRLTLSATKNIKLILKKMRSVQQRNSSRHFKRMDCFNKQRLCRSAEAQSWGFLVQINFTV